jgi:hypothetical protein
MGSFDRFLRSQIVAGIGEVEALIAEREIGDAVFSYR